ncbi:MAG: hypothetical protein G3M70_17810 [Candidatus Nitronauta litoralis]|uniref:Uncharacterized protein n=1 Tax=Candidatus Nitronauta litoralis TaxID=2705533 RepID=A0A7T0BZ61_9BACT|nr:MAG: hypothetical protein G3M70_17810 [Candidatus Nitronauta litoralis]
MRSFRFVIIVTGFLFLGLSVLSSNALAHPHSHGKNPFDHKKKAVSLHCLLKNHTNHFLKFCPHAQKTKESIQILTSACGSTPASKHGANIQNPVTPVTISIVLKPSKDIRVTHLLLQNEKPGILSLETASPPPRSLA